jgi:NADH-quinone oxidoreductase subunit N
MTSALKAASFAAFIRVLFALGYGTGMAQWIDAHLYPAFWVCSLLTMFFGNVVALTQIHLKRLLAYSSIAHTGYLLMGFIAALKSDVQFAPVLLYLVSYAAMNLGAFIILTVLAEKGDSGMTLQDLTGLAYRQPFLAVLLTIFMFSMAGIPPTAGFLAKYYLFYAGIRAGEIALVILGILCSVISAYYYLRVVVYLFMYETSDRAAAAKTVPVGALMGIGSMGLVILQMGILPEAWLRAVKSAIFQV